MTYDSFGNVLVSTQIERLSTATATGALTTSTGRYQQTAAWYDGAGRTIATADYGTNGGTILTRPATVPARSDVVLVTETKYDTATGRAFRTIDPAAKDHRTFFDHLGRTTKTVANFTGTGVVSASTPDQNITVEMTYHPSGQIATLTAKNPTTGDQITKYAYGTAKGFNTPLAYRNDLLVAEIYPDSDDTDGATLGNGSDGVMDRIEFLYNRQGERIGMRDQNGTVHTYEYDNLGRLLHDRITALGTNVDGAVRRISTVYDVVGNVKSVTSYDNQAVGSGNIVNQVLYEYDANGLLSKDFSNPTVAVVVATTPHIGYTYDATQSGGNFTKRLRLSTMKYPSGKTLTNVYGTSGSNDDLLSRLTEIREGSTSLVQYAHNGIETPMKVTYPQPGLVLDYTTSGTLDNFNRITDHAWKSGSTDVVRIPQGDDRVGSRTNRTDTLHSANS
jgi:YD repeat-containing protein